MTKEQAIQQFWASFELEAYDENTVPDNAELPYITYGVSTASIDEPVATSASIWFRSTSWAAITEKANEIEQYIGFGGRLLYHDNGTIWIKRGVPFAQRMSDEDDSIRRIYLNIEMEYIND